MENIFIFKFHYVCFLVHYLMSDIIKSFCFQSYNEDKQHPCHQSDPGLESMLC